MNDLASYRLDAANERLATAKDNIDTDITRTPLIAHITQCSQPFERRWQNGALISQSTRLSSATFKENL